MVAAILRVCVRVADVDPIMGKRLAIDVQRGAADA